MPSANPSTLRPTQLPGIELHRPTRLTDLLQHLTDGASALAGGTDVVLWASERGEPRHLVWTGGIEELHHIDVAGDPLRIGASVTLTRLIRSAAFRHAAPAVADGAQVIGSVQMRNQGTLIGNLCTASPAGDTLPGLLVHDVEIEIVRASGEHRRLDLDAFLVGPGKNALHKDELVLGVSLSRLGTLEGSAYQRFTQRDALDLAFASVAARVAFAPDGHTVRAARLALGAVGATVIEATEAAALLVGHELTTAGLQACGAAAADASAPISDHRASAEYRRQLVKILVSEVVTEAGRRAHAS
jgi:CO/xanthine dehydrogenase FAD-binding subunit